MGSCWIDAKREATGIDIELPDYLHDVDRAKLQAGPDVLREHIENLEAGNECVKKRRPADYERRCKREHFLKDWLVRHGKRVCPAVRKAVIKWKRE